MSAGACTAASLTARVHSWPCPVARTAFQRSRSPGQNPLAERRLARAAQVTALHTLSHSNIREYWWQLLQAYSKLQAFRPRVHPDAVPLHLSYQNPRYVHPHERTCSLCPHR